MQEKVPLKHKTQDHPRIRGTNIASATDTPVDLGSSPHTRDKFSWDTIALYSTGIIPAYAGQMGQNRVIRGQCRDHPRIRGTNAFFSAIAWIVSGSSPHTRDK